jgi:hypothetical protein
MRIILLFIFGLFLGPWQALCVEENAPAEMDEAAFGIFLSQLKNPFAVQIPAGKMEGQAVHAVARPSLPVPAVVKTQTPPPKPFVAPKLKVSGVLWAGPKPQAIIDDRVVGIGDVVQDAKVAAIRKGEVEFNTHGNNFIVKVQE